MRLKVFGGMVVAMLALGLLSVFAADVIKKGPAKFEIQLLWGTNLPKSPDAKHKPVDADVDRKLKSLPLSFKNYFLVNKNVVTLATGENKKVVVSEKCEVEILNIDDLKFQAAFFGKGKQTAKRTQEFPLGEMLIHGGNAPGSNAWLVVIKRIE